MTDWSEFARALNKAGLEIRRIAREAARNIEESQRRARERRSSPEMEPIRIRIYEQRIKREHELGRAYVTERCNRLRRELGLPKS